MLIVCIQINTSEGGDNINKIIKFSKTRSCSKAVSCFLLRTAF